MEAPTASASVQAWNHLSLTGWCLWPCRSFRFLPARLVHSHIQPQAPASVLPEPPTQSLRVIPLAFASLSRTIHLELVNTGEIGPEKCSHVLCQDMTVLLKPACLRPQCQNAPHSIWLSAECWDLMTLAQHPNASCNVAVCT